MAPAVCADRAPIPPPSNHRTLATARQVDALPLLTRVHLVEVCRVAGQLAQRQGPPPLPAGPGGAPRVDAAAALVLRALLRTLWRLWYHEVQSP